MSLRFYLWLSNIGVADTIGWPTLLAWPADTIVWTSLMVDQIVTTGWLILHLSCNYWPFFLTINQVIDYQLSRTIGRPAVCCNCEPLTMDLNKP